MEILATQKVTWAPKISTGGDISHVLFGPNASGLGAFEVVAGTASKTPGREFESPILRQRETASYWANAVRPRVLAMSMCSNMCAEILIGTPRVGPATIGIDSWVAIHSPASRQAAHSLSTASF